MSQLRKPLSAGAVDEYINEVIARIKAGDDAAALETAIRTFDSAATGAVVKQRLEQVLNTAVNTRILSSGQVAVTMTAAGTGYAIRDRIPVVGDGVGAELTVTEVGGLGEIVAFDVAGGNGYVASATVDTAGIGGANATFTTTISNEGKILADARAAIAAA